METITAQSAFLKRLLEAFVYDILPADVITRLEMVVKNHRGGDTLDLHERYRDEITNLINDLSSLIVNHEEAVKRLQSEPYYIQTCFFDRYELALDLLKEERIYTVPIRIDKLFKWFFISLWEKYE